MPDARRWILRRIGFQRAVRATASFLTTDADSRVSPRWLAHNTKALEAGADAVLGRIILDEEGDLCPKIWLTTSNRLHGRAAGGVADTATRERFTSATPSLSMRPNPTTGTDPGS
jgi:hypothetical protein